MYKGNNVFIQKLLIFINIAGYYCAGVAFCHIHRSNVHTDPAQDQYRS